MKSMIQIYKLQYKSQQIFNNMSKTEHQRLPELDLFRSKYRKSPTKQQIDFYQHKITRQSDVYKKKQLENKIPLCSYDSTERPILSENRIFPPASRYTRPASTYLQCAEDYLTYGFPLYSPLYVDTGRFHQVNSRLAAEERLLRLEHEKKLLDSYSRRRKICECEDQNIGSGCCFPTQDIPTFQKSPISRESYLTHSLPQNIKKTIQIPKNMPSEKEKVPQKNPYLDQNTQRNHSNHPQPQPQHPKHHHQSFNHNYNINIVGPKPETGDKNQQNKSHQSKSISNVFQSFFGGKNITQNESLHESDHHNPSYYEAGTDPQFHKVIDQGTQTNQQKQQTNRSSVLVERMMRSIPTMLDDQTFKKLIKEHTTQFNNIKIDFDDDFPIIDFDDLQETKDQYFEHSQDLLHRLNKLTGSSMYLIGEIFNKKNMREIHWPDLSQHQNKQTVTRTYRQYQ